MKYLHITAFILLVAGGLNWLLTAFGWNLVEMLLGAWPMVVTVVYVLIGLAAIYEVATHMKNCRVCGGTSMPMGA